MEPNPVFDRQGRRLTRLPRDTNGRLPLQETESHLVADNKELEEAMAAAEIMQYNMPSVVDAEIDGLAENASGLKEITLREHEDALNLRILLGRRPLWKGTIRVASDIKERDLALWKLLDSYCESYATKYQNVTYDNGEEA